LKDVLKDTGEQPDEEIPGRVLSTGAPVLVEVGCLTLTTPPPPGWMCSPTCKPLNPPILGFLWRLHHVGLPHH